MEIREAFRILRDLAFGQKYWEKSRKLNPWLMRNEGGCERENEKLWAEVLRAV